MRQALFVVLVALVIPLVGGLAACGMSQEKAHKKIDELKIPFSAEEFVGRAEKGDVEVVKLFLAAGISPNVTTERRTVAGIKLGGETALMAASGGGHTEVVKALLGTGAEINVKDEGGWTAWRVALVGGETEVMKALLAAGANVNATWGDRETALMYASRWDRIEIVKLLLAHGANINAKNNKGETALSLASQFGHRKIVSLLRQAGAIE